MATEAKPTTIDDFKQWALATQTVDLNDQRTKNRCETNIITALNEVQTSPFFARLPKVLSELAVDYQAATSAQLLMGDPTVVLHTKSYESIVNKCFRKNVIQNKNFPEPPPDGGWITPENWYARLNDLLRGTIVCKYLDGPEALAEKLVTLAKECGHKTVVYTQQQDEGYYAYHFYLIYDVSLLGADWEARPTSMSVEIQLTTQLQEALGQLTHRLYEVARLRLEQGSDDWKWDFRSDRFKAAYLSHTLHMLEATLVELRERDQELKGEVTP